MTKEIGHWHCNNCETDNSNLLNECEVCGGIPPLFIDFSCVCHDINEPSLCKCHVDNTDSLFLQVDDNKPFEVFKDDIELDIQKPTILTLIAANNITERRKSIKVEIERPTIQLFEVSKKSVLDGDMVSVRWNVLNAEHCAINGEEKSCKGEENTSASKELTIKASNSAGEVSKSLRITVHPRPTISFKASKQKLHAGKGENVELKWNVQNALKCNILYDDVVKSNVGNEGLLTVIPEKTTIYTLQVLGLDGTTYIEQGLTIEVFPDAECSFSIDKDIVLEGEPFTLSWSVKDAKQVRLDGSIVKHNYSCYISGVYSSKDYVLTVYDEFGSKEYKIHVNPLSQPQIISFKCSKERVHQGKNEEVVLSWDVRNSKEIYLLCDGKILNSCMPSGNVKLNVDVITCYTLQVIALNHTTKIEENIIVNAFPDAEVEFKADKRYVLPDIPFAISWKVINANRVLFEGENVSHSDVIIIKKGIQKPTEYKLEVEDAFGLKTHTININLLKPPQIKTINVPRPPIVENKTHFTFHIPEFKLMQVSSPYVSVSHYKKVSFREVKVRYMPRTFKCVRSIVMKSSKLNKLFTTIKKRICNGQ